MEFILFVLFNAIIYIAYIAGWNAGWKAYEENIYCEKEGEMIK